jgi:hypothetical protein
LKKKKKKKKKEWRKEEGEEMRVKAMNVSGKGNVKKKKGGRKQKTVTGVVKMSQKGDQGSPQDAPLVG